MKHHSKSEQTFLIRNVQLSYDQFAYIAEGYDYKHFAYMNCGYTTYVSAAAKLSYEDAMQVAHAVTSQGEYHCVLVPMEDVT